MTVDILDLILYPEVYRLFLSILTGAIVTLFSIFFAITLVQVQHIGEKYSSRILEDIKKDFFIRTSFIFFIAALLSTIGALITIDYAKISSFILGMVVSCVLLVCLSFFYLIDFLNPENLIHRIRTNTIENFDRFLKDDKTEILNEIRIGLLQLRQILFKIMKEDIFISTKIVDSFLDITKEIYNDYEYGVGIILTQLESIGKRLIDEDLYELRYRLMLTIGKIGEGASKRLKQTKIHDVPELYLELAGYAKEKGRINSDDLSTMQSYLFALANQFSSEIRKAAKESTPNIVAIIIIIAGMIKNQLKVQERKMLLKQFDESFRRLIFGDVHPDASLFHRIIKESSRMYRNYYYEINDIKDTRKELILKIK